MQAVPLSPTAFSALDNLGPITNVLVEVVVVVVVSDQDWALKQGGMSCVAQCRGLPDKPVRDERDA